MVMGHAHKLIRDITPGHMQQDRLSSLVMIPCMYCPQIASGIAQVHTDTSTAYSLIKTYIFWRHIMDRPRVYSYNFCQSLPASGKKFQWMSTLEFSIRYLYFSDNVAFHYQFEFLTHQSLFDNINQSKATEHSISTNGFPGHDPGVFWHETMDFRIPDMRLEFRGMSKPLLLVPHME